MKINLRILNFHDIGIIVHSGEEMEFDLNFWTDGYDYHPGVYSIRKEVSFHNQDLSRAFYNAVAVFEVK